MFDPLFTLLFLAAVIVPIAAFFYWWNPRRRPRGKMGCVSPLFFGCVAVAAFAFYAGPTLFVSNDGAEEIHVIPPQSRADRFTEELADLVRRYGFRPYLAQSREGDGLTNHIVVASSFRLNIWGSNEFIDTRDTADECGRYSEFGHSDPGQYSIRVSRMVPFGTKDDIRALVSKIAADLRSTGHDVRTRPVTCSPLSKLRAPH